MGTNVPDLRGRFLQEKEVPGQKIEAGIPNISGGFSAANLNSSSGNTTGPFSFKNSSAIGHQDGGSNDVFRLNFSFDASLASPVYGRSDTVQPPAYTVRYLIRALP